VIVPAHTGPVTGRAISLDTIREAASIVYEAAIRTPLVRLHARPHAGAAASAGPEILLKLETLQPIGSFKIRGAYNAVRRLSAGELASGVWTVSAGNAAQGVAFAARRVGAAASVLVADTAPATKLRAIERLGARVELAPYEECWQTVVTRRSGRMRGHFVHPFDDDHFISGNGTIGLELVEDLPDVDAVIAPLGGGGLIAGVARAVKSLRPDVRVYAAEPATAAPLARSFSAGRASRFENWEPSFVDGAGGRSVLDTMWPLLRECVDESIVVGLDAVAAAMAIAADRVHVIAEGAAGCAIAAALAPDFASRGHRKVAVIVSGGNIDLPRFAQVVGAGASGESL
jgi:threonine dehydratase